MQLSVGTTAVWRLAAQERPSAQAAVVRYGARRCSGQRLQPQTLYGRRRSQEYEQDYEQEYEQSVAPDPAPVVRERSVPMYLAIPGALLLLFTLFRIFKKIQGRG